MVGEKWRGGEKSVWLGGMRGRGVFSEGPPFKRKKVFFPIREKTREKSGREWVWYEINHQPSPLFTNVVASFFFSFFSFFFCFWKCYCYVTASLFLFFFPFFLCFLFPVIVVHTFWPFFFHIKYKTFIITSFFC